MHVTSSRGPHRLAPLLLCAMILTGCGSASIPSEEETARPQILSEPQAPAPGSEGHMAGTPSIVAAVDRDAWDALLESLDENDADSFEYLLLTDRTFVIEEGDRVLVLEPGTDSLKVRVLEGANAGKEGWVQPGWIHTDDGPE